MVVPNNNAATLKDALTLLKKEEYASSEGQRRNCAAVKDAQQSSERRSCIKNGAEAKRCSSEGCTNLVIKGGVC